MQDDAPAPADVLPDAAPEVDLETAETPDQPDVDTPDTEVTPETPEEPEEPAYTPPQKIKVDLPTFEGEIPVDEYGNIDASKLGEYLQARDKYILDAAKATSDNAYYDNLYTQREWQDVEKAFPDLAADTQLRGMVDSLRTADAIKGGTGSLMDAAKQIDALRQSSVEKGRQDQQATISRQKAVTTTASSRTSSPDATRTATLRKQAAQGNDEARLALLSDLYDSGALNA